MILKVWNISKNSTVVDLGLGLMKVIFPLDDDAVVAIDGAELTIFRDTLCIVKSEVRVLPKIVMGSCYVLGCDKPMWLEFFRFFPYIMPSYDTEKLKNIELGSVKAMAAKSRLAQMIEEIETEVSLEHQKLLFGLFMLEIFLPKTKGFSTVDSYYGILMEFYELLEANFRSERSTRFYARRLGVSPRKLNTLCRKWFDGKAFFGVLMDRLLYEAEHRLKYSDDPLKAIARELGFKSSQNFRMYFVRYRGISPFEFRKGMGIP